MDARLGESSLGGVQRLEVSWWPRVASLKILQAVRKQLALLLLKQQRLHLGALLFCGVLVLAE